MRVMVLEPGKPPAVQEIANSLESFQLLVGGYIETVPLDGLEGVMVLNEEGKVHGLPANVFATDFANIFADDWIAGTAVVTGRLDGAGDLTPLPAATEREISARWRAS